MRVPRSGPEGRFRQLVRLNTTTYTVTRSDQAIGQYGEKNESTTTHNADIWVYAPNNSPIETDYGDRLMGDLVGVALPSEDLEHADRIDHGGDTYEILDPFHIPNENDQVLKLLSLERKIN